MPVGFRKWVVGKALKEGTKAIRSVLPGAKFNLKQTFKKTDKELDKLKKTVQETKHYFKD